jgi:hypothetical protein
MGKSGGPGRDRTDDLFHAMAAEKQPEIGFEGFINRRIGQKWICWPIFPANFRPKLTLNRAAWAGGFFSSVIEGMGD